MIWIVICGRCSCGDLEKKNVFVDEDAENWRTVVELNYLYNVALVVLRNNEKLEYLDSQGAKNVSLNDDCKVPTPMFRDHVFFITTRKKSALHLHLPGDQKGSAIPIKQPISMVDCVSVSMPQRDPSYDPENLHSTSKGRSSIKTRLDYILRVYRCRKIYTN